MHLFADRSKQVRTDTVLVEYLHPSPLNPRTVFDEEGLNELAASLAELGMIEPIIVREIPDPNNPKGPIPGMYRDIAPHNLLEIVAGHRRYLAAKRANLSSVPIRNLGVIDDATALRVMLVENLQRTDLDPIEEAKGYAQLNRVAGMTQSQIAKAIHRDQSSVANKIRLLQLPPDVQDMISAKLLSFSHGVALVKHAEYPALCSAIAAYVATNKLPSAALEVNPDQNLVDHLTKLKLVHSTQDYTQAFSEEICRACPFGAYRVKWGWHNVCLKPEHWQELQKAGLAERAAQEEARIARQKDKQAAGLAKVATLRPPSEEEKLVLDPAFQERLAAAQAKVDAARAAGERPDHNDVQVVSIAKAAEETVQAKADGIPLRRTLAYGTYEEIGREPPLGCTDDCECRSNCRENLGGPLIAICLDPARFKTLRRRETIARNKARRTHAKALAEQIQGVLAKLETVGPAELAILGSQAVYQRVRADRVNDSWRHLVDRPAYPADRGTRTDWIESDVGDLHARLTRTLVAETEVVASMISAILGAELALYHEGGGMTHTVFDDRGAMAVSRGPELATWYLGARGAAPIDTGAIATASLLEAESEESEVTGPPCDGCGGEGLHLTPLQDDNGEVAQLCANCIDEMEAEVGEPEAGDDDE